MKVKYIGPDMGATGPQNGKIYEVTEAKGRTIYVIDENADRESYAYDALSPTLRGGPGATYSGGRFYLVKDDKNGSLAKAGVSPLE